MSCQTSRNVTALIGYAWSPVALIVLKRRSSGGVTPPSDLRFSTINADGDQAYPISAVTFLLVWQDMCKAGMQQSQAKLVKSWLDYALGPGQQVAPQLQYAPLPDQIKSKAEAKVKGLQCNGQPLAGAAS